MLRFKKALSVFLCTVMVFSTLCFTPSLGDALTANAAVTNTDTDTALYVPEVIYLYPDVTSWKETVQTPFMYYVGNKVNTADIYSAPEAQAVTDTVGKVYFAARDGMNNVNLSVKFLDKSLNEISADNTGSVTFSETDKGNYRLFTVTEGTSPKLTADTTGCYIEWCLTYENNSGEQKALFAYSYVYKPYVVPYGAALRNYNQNGTVNVFAQQITWVTGVHSADNTEKQTNALYPYYMSLASETSSAFAFSPFLSKINKAYVAGQEVSGAATADNGGYYAVFSGTDTATSYFHAGQTGAQFTKSAGADSWFHKSVQQDNTYPVAFDYMNVNNGSKVSDQFSLVQGNPTRIGTITVDISRYNNLNEIPLLAVGMMITDTDYSDSASSSVPTASWYIGEATNSSHAATGYYSTQSDLEVARTAVDTVFASESNISSSNISLGIKYAGAWNKEIDKTASTKKYTVKSYYESRDREGDYQAAAAAVSLNVNAVDKSSLRASVDKAVSYFGALGVKENWNSLYYDVNYGTVWNDFVTAYKNAATALACVESTADFDTLATNLENALAVLLSGKGLRVYFDVNYDNIGINLWINPTSSEYTWNAEDETAVIDGTVSSNRTYGATAFTPSVGSYVFSSEKISGTFNYKGCTVFDCSDEDGVNVKTSSGDRHNFDFTGTGSKTVTFEASKAGDIDTVRFWTWYNNSENGIYDNFALRLKIEAGTTKTAYSPVGKVVGDSYGTLPTPERTGYTFAGWYTDAECNEEVTASSSVTARILYAKWEKNHYSVAFDGNGSTSGEMSKQNFIFDESATLTKNSYAKTGYTFGSWSDGNGHSYSDGENVKNLSSENGGTLTLYAQWIPNNYTVAFDPNTGTGSMSEQSAVYGSDFALTANTFKKTGYTFVGWSRTSDGKAEYADTKTVKNLCDDIDGKVTLYAVWQANTFTAVFNSNTGTGVMENASVTYNSGVSLPECTFTKTGYTFAGWSLSASSNTLITNEEYSLLKTNDGDTVTLYAVWSENSYTLSFNANGGDGAKIEPHTYTYEQEVNIAKNIFTKTGYTLSGWSLTKDGEKVYENGATVKNVSAAKNGNVTLWAVWTPISYTVKFDGNTGTGRMSDVTAYYGTAVTLPENGFTKTGYHLVGWALTKDGEVEFENTDKIIDLTATDGETITLFAVWEINTYTVTFEYFANGVLTSSDVKVTHGSTASPPANFLQYAHYGDTVKHYVFESWSGNIENVTKDITVEARYTEEAHDMTTTEKEPTCQEAGYTRYYCTKCTYSYDIPIAKVDHAWDDGKTAIEPGCVTEGSFVYSCKTCTATKSEPILAVGHSFTTVPYKAASCKENGNIEHLLCSRCSNHFALGSANDAPLGDKLSEEEYLITALPHTPGVEATCTTDQVCTVCGSVLQEKFGHTEKIEYTTTEATCTVKGNYTKTVSCTVCFSTLSETTEYGTVPHKYVDTVVDPTCTKGGYTEHKCSVCSDTYTDTETPATGHTEGEWVVTTAPKCTEAGVETNYCAVCQQFNKTREVDALGHDDGEWSTTVAPKCEEWGTETLKCTRCSTELNTRSIQPTGHKKTHKEVTVTPKCETPGKESVICDACEKELSFTVIKETGHTESGTLSCETDVICSTCRTVLKEHYGHKWDSGTVIKEATETDKGSIKYTCLNDSTHVKYEDIPVRVIIAIPELKDGEAYALYADKNGFAGNVNDFISVEEGLSYTVTSSDTSKVAIASNGKITVLGDGKVTITVTADGGKYEKSFPAEAKTLKTVTFITHSGDTSFSLYNGDIATPPTVADYTEDGFIHSFLNWSRNGSITTDFTVTGDMTFTAIYTSSCDYTRLDKLSELFTEVIDGRYDNEEELRLYKNEIAQANASIAEFAQNRDTRDRAQQNLIDALSTSLSELISVLYPEENATIEIRGASALTAGSSTELKAYMLPLETEIPNGIWTSSDDSVGFFANGRFYAVAAGTVTVTVTVGSLTDSMDISVAAIGDTAARVIMFDSLLTNANYIVENSYIITTTTNMFWAPDGEVHFRVITNGTFEEYYVYINNELATPDENGVYTIPANTGDAHVRIDGIVKNTSGEKLSFWDSLLAFFKKIADFFRNLFK